MARVAIIFDNIGPYHWARLEAAGRVCDLLAIEVRDNCPEHGWVRQPRQVPFQTLTLVNVASGQKPQLGELTRRLGKVLAEFKPQAVFLPGWFCAAAFVAHNWCNRNSVPAVVMSESNSWDEKRSALKEWAKRRLTRMYSAALVGGTTHKNYMIELGLPAERVFLGYDAVENEHFSRKADEVRGQGSEVRNKYGLPERYFLASARFIKKKNLPRLFEAFARYRALAGRSKIEDGRLESGNQKEDNRLHDNKTTGLSVVTSPVVRGPVVPWSLVLLGDGPLRSSIFNLRASLGLDAYVHLPGFKQYDELPVYYSLASAFIHASSTEQWGLVVNEAMASGLPVLVSNRCGCAMDLVKDGVNGFTFDPHNIERLASLMLKISTFNFPLSAFGSESHSIISNWSVERFAQGASAAVEEALKVGALRTSFFDNVLLRFLAMVK